MNILRKFNWRYALLAFVICEGVIMCSACGESIAEISNMLPAIGQLATVIVTFIAGLGGAVSPEAQKAVAEANAAIQASLTEAGSLLKTWTQSTSTTVLGKVTDILTAAGNAISGFTSGLGLSAAAQQKVNEFAGLFLTAVQGVLAIIPAFAPKVASANPRELLHLDRTGAAQIKALHQSLQAQYAEIVSTPTGDAAVDAVLAALPKLVS